MPKYLLTVSYTAQGAQGLKKDGGSKRKAAAIEAVKSVGGTIEGFYFALGKHDAFVIADVPDAASMTALSLAVNSTGAMAARTTALLTVEEMDAACKKTVGYRPPGA